MKHLLLIVAAMVFTAIAASAMAQDADYPIEAFEAMAQCATNPACQLKGEDRLSDSVESAAEVTYTGICMSGCWTVCSADDCWCEVDPKCER